MIRFKSGIEEGTLDVPPPVTRFAPSPTGYLHLGHVVNAIYVWGVARAAGGRVLLRVEDHDRIRSRAEFESALLQDLDWLGFVPDSGRTPVCRQSDRSAVYRQAVARLRSHHHVYTCVCSRREIGADRYPGTCRDRDLPESAGRGLRVVLPPGSETFDDVVLGSITQEPASQCGDLLIRDRDGNWTYQFAVTVDDLEDDVTLIIRGVDLLESTGRQLALARMLGRQAAPRFLHHPLIVHPSGEKLSKSNRDTGVRQLRDAGVSPSEVIGRAAAAVGLVPPDTRLTAADVGMLFR